MGTDIEAAPRMECDAVRERKTLDAIPGVDSVAVSRIESDLEPGGVVTAESDSVLDIKVFADTGTESDEVARMESNVVLETEVAAVVGMAIEELGMEVDAEPGMDVDFTLEIELDVVPGMESDGALGIELESALGMELDAKLPPKKELLYICFKSSIFGAPTQISGMKECHSKKCPHSSAKSLL